MIGHGLALEPYKKFQHFSMLECIMYELGFFCCKNALKLLDN